jgi:hypothetical protein
MGAVDEAGVPAEHVQVGKPNKQVASVAQRSGQGVIWVLRVACEVVGKRVECQANVHLNTTDVPEQAAVLQASIHRSYRW